MRGSLVELRKIWDAAPHNAFTDLLRWRGRWFCVFREGAAHVSPDGALRVLTSADGRRWRSAARVTSSTGDLRDAKITVTPQGELMLTGAAALHPPSPVRHQSLAWFSRDGFRWSEPVPIGDPDMWLWRVTWRQGVAYSIGYNTNRDRSRRFVHLYVSEDGRTFTRHAENIFAGESPGEHSLLFQPDGTCCCLLRRDLGAATAQWGRSRPPYREWEWRDLGVRIGGPHLTRTPEGAIIAGLRLYDDPVRTSLCRIDPERARLTELLPLPSAGDSSYPGFVWRGNELWMSYYSSHTGKSRIYLARLELSASGDNAGNAG